MKIHVLSDLHLEFADYHLQVLDADVIVLAGDISVGVRGFEWAKKLLAKTQAEIVYVAGNHEFYNFVIEDITERLRALAASEPRIHFLENDEVIIGNVRFLGCTLWTDFMLYGQDNFRECKREAYNLNDFRIIHTRTLASVGSSESTFTPQAAIDLFKCSLAWLKEKLDAPFNGKTVVVTHHLPSYDSVAMRFAGDLLSACFASRLDYMFGKMDVWIHGHTHDCFDYTKDGTRVVCNPRGYCRYDREVENYDFNPKLVIEV